MSRVALVAYGSRGDVQPLALLGAALTRAGHDAVLYAPPDLLDLADAVGCVARPLGAPIRDAMPRSVRDPVDLARFLRFVRDQIAVQVRTLVPALEGVDQVLGAGLVWGAATAAEAVGAPYAFVALCPAVLPSAHHPPLLAAWWDLGRANRVLWGLSERLVDRELVPALALARRPLGLGAPAGAHRHLLGGRVLLACDPALAVAPPDLHVPTEAIGYPTPPGGPLPERLEAFLADGAAPAYVGLGSMTHPRGRAVADALVAAVRRAGLRVVVSRGWGGLDPHATSADVLVVDDVPHASLFPRVAVAVHHGGAGTVATAARAGVPQVVLPHLFDQHYWARRVGELGVGGSRSLRSSEKSLALAVTEAVACRDAARALADRLSRDPLGDGVRAIVARLAERAA